MALLYRFTRLNDRSNTGIFTFIVTRTVTRDLHRDAVTKDFAHGYHRWALSFLRTEKTLGVFLIIRNPAPGSRCCVDFTLTLLNREHFSRNESLSEKQIAFTVDSPAHGAAKWLPLAELASRRFADETGEFLVELSMANVSTMFDADIKIPSHFLGNPLGVGYDEARRYSTATQHSVAIESPYLSFGGFEWNVAVLPFGSPSDNENPRAPKVLLNRLTGFDHPCRVQYRLVLGDGTQKVESGLLDQISDLSGRIRGFHLKGVTSIRELMSHRAGSLHVHLQMVSANVISEAKVPIQGIVNTQQGKRRQGGRLSASPASTANCYDRDKQAWTVETDFERDYLRLKLFYADMGAVPRNHLRFVAWNTYVIRAPPGGGKESVLAVNAPHSAYYVQDGMDLGVLIDVDIPTRVLREQLSPYVDSCNQLTIHIEWLENHLLFGANYHRYDDIARIHQQQMRREVAALQSENYNLERQVFSYQKSISYANTTSQPRMPTMVNHQPPQQMQLQHRGAPMGQLDEDEQEYISRRMAELQTESVLGATNDEHNFV
ncbi:uncharacterized protein LOC100905722 [Galendromus occidentalis]|uniref:Uncharacterized protein LOC100905722 n=1 Tax=Galendromus occidentalis TaxID=34638 RepID=A0AAJ7SEC4_9ACAR|nr:uncharacterized protein LOC100905722 [Galendromus occidentalis]